MGPVAPAIGDATFVGSGYGGDGGNATIKAWQPASPYPRRQRCGAAIGGAGGGQRHRHQHDTRRSGGDGGNAKVIGSTAR